MLKSEKIAIIIIIIIAQIMEIKCRTINNEGIQLIEKYELFHSHFLVDSNGLKLIGYNHKCQREDSCRSIIEPITQILAEELLKRDLNADEECVEHYAPGLNNDQFSALVSFTWSVGCSALRTSTLLHHIKEQNYGLASKEFMKFSHTREETDVSDRRKEEMQLFCKSGGCDCVDCALFY